jgi:hypothetical protein
MAAQQQLARRLGGSSAAPVSRGRWRTENPRRSLGIPELNRSSGCIWQRSAQPSAQPAVVRIHHLMGRRTRLRKGDRRHGCDMRPPRDRAAQTTGTRDSRPSRNGHGLKPALPPAGRRPPEHETGRPVPSGLPGPLTGRSQLAIALLRHLCPHPGASTDDVATMQERAVTAKRQHASGQR